MKTSIINQKTVKVFMTPYNCLEKKDIWVLELLWILPKSQSSPYSYSFMHDANQRSHYWEWGFRKQAVSQTSSFPRWMEPVRLPWQPWTGHLPGSIMISHQLLCWEERGPSLVQESSRQHHPTRTHTYTVKPLSYMVKPKSTNLSDTQLHKFTHGFTHIMHKLSESRPVSSSPAVLFQVKKPLLFPFNFASCWSREESFSRVSQSLSLSLSSSCSAASQHNLTQNTCVEACAQLCVSARVYFCL